MVEGGERLSSVLFDCSDTLLRKQSEWQVTPLTQDGELPEVST